MAQPQPPGQQAPQQSLAQQVPRGIVVAPTPGDLRESERWWELRRVIAYTVLGGFGITTLTTVTLFITNALEVTSLTDVGLGALAGTVFSQAVGLVGGLVSGVFPQAERAAQ